MFGEEVEFPTFAVLSADILAGSALDLRGTPPHCCRLVAACAVWKKLAVEVSHQQNLVTKRGFNSLSQ